MIMSVKNKKALRKKRYLDKICVSVVYERIS